MHRAREVIEPTLATAVLPRRIGRYRLCFRVATGGMATVYLARADGTAGPQLVALKHIHPHLAAAPGFVDMFCDEARIASRIHHPNVCSVLDFEADGAGSYIVMEYLFGESVLQVLRALARQGPVGLHGSVRIARAIADACEGLHAAHELRGHDGSPLEVVHRDVSPQNLFLTYDGVLQVVDFGVASAAQRTHETKTGMVKGKLGYLPPEALKGRTVDRRGDVWQLGVVLWELLTGRRLFLRASEGETIRAMADPIPAPSELAHGVPGGLDAIVLRALATDVDARPPTARALGRELLQFVSEQGLPVGAADLSEWMDELFPVGRACQRQLVDLALQMDLAEKTPSGVERTKSRGATPVRGSPVRRSDVRRRISLALAGAAISLLLAVGAAALAVSGPPTSEAAPAPHESVAPTPPEGPACDEARAVAAAPLASTDAYLFEVWPELDDAGRVVLRVRPTSNETEREPVSRARRVRRAPRASDTAVPTAPPLDVPTERANVSSADTR